MSEDYPYLSDYDLKPRPEFKCHACCLVCGKEHNGFCILKQMGVTPDYCCECFRFKVWLKPTDTTVTINRSKACSDEKCSECHDPECSCDCHKESELVDDGCHCNACLAGQLYWCKGW